MTRKKGSSKKSKGSQEQESLGGQGLDRSDGGDGGSSQRQGEQRPQISGVSEKQGGSAERPEGQGFHAQAQTSTHVEQSLSGLQQRSGGGYSQEGSGRGGGSQGGYSKGGGGQSGYSKSGGDQGGYSKGGGGQGGYSKGGGDQSGYSKSGGDQSGYSKSGGGQGGYSKGGGGQGGYSKSGGDQGGYSKGGGGQGGFSKGGGDQGGYSKSGGDQGGYSKGGGGQGGYSKGGGGQGGYSKGGGDQGGDGQGRYSKSGGDQGGYSKGGGGQGGYSKSGGDQGGYSKGGGGQGGYSKGGGGQGGYSKGGGDQGGYSKGGDGQGGYSKGSDGQGGGDSDRRGGKRGRTHGRDDRPFQGQEQQKTQFEQQFGGSEQKSGGDGRHTQAQGGKSSDQVEKGVRDDRYSKDNQGRSSQQMESDSQPPKNQKSAKQSKHKKEQPEPTTSKSQTMSPSVPPIEFITSTTAKQIAHHKPVIPGTMGRKLLVEVNHLQINLGNLLTAYHYDVTITPEKVPKKFYREIIRSFTNTYWRGINAAFDGRKNIYTPREVPQLTGEVPVPALGRNIPTAKVVIQLARVVDLSVLRDLYQPTQVLQPALQCLDIVLRSVANNNCVISGSAIYSKQFKWDRLGQCAVSYLGLYHSAIRGSKLLLNVDITRKAFLMDGPVSEVMVDIFMRRPYDTRRPITQYTNWGDYDYNDVNNALRGAKVLYKMPNQTEKMYTIKEFGPPANRAEFLDENNRRMTVAEYFRNIRNINLQYPFLPVIIIVTKDPNRKIMLPPELCFIPEKQTIPRKMTDNQKKMLLNVMTTSTEVRRNEIFKLLNTLNMNQCDTIRQFGLSLNNVLEAIQARVLNPPRLKYAQTEMVEVQKGIWNTKNIRFLRPASATKWTAIGNMHVATLNDFTIKLEQAARASGLEITKAIPPRSLQDFNILKFLKDCKSGDYDFIIVVLPSRRPAYSDIKKVAEVEKGILTQCVKRKTAEECNPTVAANIILKLNSKLNGKNHKLSAAPKLFDIPTMIMGADVTHPTPQQRGEVPSVAAITASYDPIAFSYNWCWRLQNPAVEVISDLEMITQEKLNIFAKENNGIYPKRIVFFRDGVSEGQFEQVREKEVTAIRRACTNLNTNYKPKLTFLVVQKRHHTRIFPRNPRDGIDKFGNVPPGTCIDTTITNPLMQDFYLVSHATIRGTVRPTKYCTLEDDNDFTNDEIEHLAYYLCHMYTRCNRAVSYPAPTYYAHLAAARAKAYTETIQIDLNNLADAQRRLSIKSNILQNNPMFFV